MRLGQGNPVKQISLRETLMDKKEDKKDIKTPKGLSATKKPLNGIDIHPQLKVTKESEAEDLTVAEICARASQDSRELKK